MQCFSSQKSFFALRSPIKYFESTTPELGLSGDSEQCLSQA